MVCESLCASLVTGQLSLCNRLVDSSGAAVHLVWKRAQTNLAPQWLNEIIKVILCALHLAREGGLGPPILKGSLSAVELVARRAWMAAAEEKSSRELNSVAVGAASLESQSTQYLGCGWLVFVGCYYLF